MANPNNFVAWLSDENDDAYCRVHGLTGKKADNCGQAELPAAAGPWVRTDGYPFADAIESMLAPDYRVIAPLQYNEFGARVTTSPPHYFTGSDENGAARIEGITGVCENWTSATGQATGGETTSTGRRWNFGTNYSCATGRLACLERVPGAALPRLRTPGRLAFVTSVGGTGDLSTWPAAGDQTGIAAGDAICQNLAADAGLPQADSFKAWLSDSSNNAIDRLVHDGPWVRLDGALFAEDKAGLTATQRPVPLNLTETGVYLGEESVRTATRPTGRLNTAASETACGDWTSEALGVSTTGGRPVFIGANWTAGLGRACSDPTPRLYCLADFEFIPPVDELFADRFEAPP